MRATKTLTGRGLLAVLAGVALVSALLAAGWVIYRRLPNDGASTPFGARAESATTTLRLRLRRELLDFPVATQGVQVRFYPINMTAARNEYDSERRPGQRFEEFAVRLMGDRQPVTAELDERGEAMVSLPPGRWWVHASVGEERELSWRLPVNVAGREKLVELTPENAYARAQRF
jgi:hypothetical protein